MWGARSLVAPFGAVLCALAPIGCKEVSYKAATVHDEVATIGTKYVPSGQEANVDVEGTRLRLHLLRLCNVVEDKEIARKHVQESDEDVTLEALLMGFSAVPLGGGIALLADAPHVYPRDANQRLYNETGKSSAIAFGALALTAGLGMLVPATVSLVRRKKPKVDEEKIHADGDTMEMGVACHDQATVAGVAVQGKLDDGRVIGLGTVGADGRLLVDLVGVLQPAELGGQDEPATLEVLVAGQSYALVDLEPALKVHAARRERHWAAANPQRCDLERSEAACGQVREFARVFPKSQHAREANALLQNIGKPRRIPQ